MKVKDVKIAISPSKSHAVLTIIDESGNEHSLVANPDQIEQMHKVISYTFNAVCYSPQSDNIYLLH